MQLFSWKNTKQGICKLSVYACFVMVMVIVYTTFPTILNTIVKDKNRDQSGLDGRPHVVLGILSADGKEVLRQTQRSTWIKAMLRLKHKLPFRVSYKFLIDLPTNETVRENNMNNDILYLNITTHGRAVKFGEKMYKWLKYIHLNYPDAMLGAKLDDDAFLCVPQVFDRLDALISPNLYYGWKHGTGQKIYKDVRIDEMFVVLGRNLISKIAKRTYCGERVCKNKDELIDIDFGDTSLAEWLSVYKGIDFKADNDRIVQCGANAHKLYEKFIKPDFCTHQLIFHKSTREIMKKLQHYNDFYRNATISSGNEGRVTGTSFTGEIQRIVPPKRILRSTSKLAVFDNFTECENWAVVTTVFAPSRAVLYISKLPQWCIVIVADISTPSKETYLKYLVQNKARIPNVKYLSIDEQNSLYPALSKVIPIKHFGRKNIGYMYAIHHKAKHIWDFDDDNVGIFDLHDLEDTKSVTLCKGLEYFLVNTYPYFGISENLVWPRGFPLQHIKDNRTLTPICQNNNPTNIGVVQSLANKQPDVDAIFRLTRNVPFNFFSSKQTHSRFILPPKTYAPFNAQSTLWFSTAFKFMALPISVNGRVSDIWRSYIAQYFFHKENLSLAFSTPYVIQERNEHTIIADFNAELDLYEKSLQMIILLRNNTYNDIKSLYDDLYRRNYLEQKDLDFIIVWQETLKQILK